MADLKTCPFCGEPPVVNHVEYGGEPMVVIRHCIASTSNRHTIADAAERWNRRAQDVRGEAMEPIDYDALEQTLEHMAGGMDRQLHGDMIDALFNAAAAISRLRSKLAEWEGDGIEKDAAISALRAAAGEPPKEPPPGACE